MAVSSNMVKFLTQSCPKCLAKMTFTNGEKCLCIVRGHIVPARGYVKGDKSKDPDEDDDPFPQIQNPEKLREEVLIAQRAQKGVDDMKIEEEEFRTFTQPSPSKEKKK